MTLACILLVEELRFDLLKLCPNIRMVHREFAEKRKVSESSIGLAMIDEVARRLRDKKNHDTQEGTRNDLNASNKVSRCTSAVSALTYS